MSENAFVSRSDGDVTQLPRGQSRDMVPPWVEHRSRCYRHLGLYDGVQHPLSSSPAHGGAVAAGLRSVAQCDVIIMKHAVRDGRGFAWRAGRLLARRSTARRRLGGVNSDDAFWRDVARGTADLVPSELGRFHEFCHRFRTRTWRAHGAGPDEARARERAANITFEMRSHSSPAAGERLTPDPSPPPTRLPAVCRSGRVGAVPRALGPLPGALRDARLARAR